MWASIRSKLAVRIGVTIALASLLISLFLAGFLYSKTYEVELSEADDRLAQLVATVEKSAAVAAYLDNQDLAHEIAEGLVGNDVVSGLTFTSINGMRIDVGDRVLRGGARNLSFPLMSPFIENELIGSIIIGRNQALIQAHAREAALISVATLVVLSVALASLVMLVVHMRFTKPLRGLAQSLHKIKPGDSRLLKPIRRHQHDEIGSLVGDINTLLKSVKTSLDEEQRLRTDMELLAYRFRLIFENASGGIVLTDSAGTIIMYNPSFERIVGRQRMRKLLRNDDQRLTDLFVEPDDVSNALAQSEHTPGLELDLRLRDIGNAQPMWLHALFSPVHDESGILMIECIVYDVTERAHRERQARIEAEHDPLTGLMNRRACRRHVERILEDGDKNDVRVGVFLVDLDKFKPINDNYGHEAGDRVLQEIAARLRRAVRAEDLVVRWGGDEFVVVIIEHDDAVETDKTATRVLEQLNMGIDIGSGTKVKVGASIGIALYPQHSDDFDQLVELADQTMYATKTKGGRHYTIYEAVSPTRSAGSPGD